MSRNKFAAVADLLDSCASLIEQYQTEKTAGATQAREDEVEKLAAQYAKTTGVELSLTQRDALSRGDSAVIEVVKQATAAHNIPTLGGAPIATTATVVSPTTTTGIPSKEARRKSAWNTFEKQNS